MALSLPYPGLDFVPLDTLRAEQVNRIVANYTYIANQFPIGTNNLATAVQNSINNAGGILPGETWSPNGWVVCPGLITNVATEVHFSIPTGQHLKGVSSASCNTLDCYIHAPVRTPSTYHPYGGRLGTSAGTVRNIWTAYVSACTVSSNGTVSISLSANFQDGTSASYEVVNNVPVAVLVNSATSIRFS